MSEPTLRQAARNASAAANTRNESRMDAPLRLATSEGERWAYVADKLNEAAERNERTAAILERLSARLDGHDERIKALERREEAATERALDEATGSESGAPDLTPRSLPALLNRVYTDWRTVVMIGLALAWMWQTLVGPHLGIVLH